MKRFVIVLLAAAVLSSQTFAGPILRQRSIVVVSSESGSQPSALSSQIFKHQETTRRAFFRTLLKDRLSKESRGERKRLLRRILGDEDLQTIALAYADYLQASEPTLAVEDGDEDSDSDVKFFRFFQWLIENQDQIIAFLEKIFAIFDKVAMAQPMGA